MANNGDIRSKIVLEGEKEYSAALKEAQRNLKVLRSELKAETAELGKNATEQQKNEVKTKNLQKQIKEQEKVVRTYENALKEVREKYGDNEEAIAKWEVKLNDARTALANMKNGLNDVGESFKQVENGASRSILEMNALADSFGKISDVASGMSDAIEGAFTGALSIIKDTIGAVWSELMDIAAKSDNYLDLASFLGASATDVQKWDRAMRAAHGDLSSITSMISKLKYGGKSDSVAEWFGISGENYTNDLEYAEAVLSKIAEDKEAMVAAGTWDDAMSDIFGAKKVQEIDSILSDWDEIQRNLKEFDVENGGVGMTEDEIQTMSDLYSQVGLLQEKWNAFKDSVETKIFGKLALELSSNFHGALDALMAFMDAETEEEREKALEDFQKNIEEAFTKLGEAIAAAAEALDEAGGKLQQSENSYVKLLGDILVGLSDAMEWITTEGNLEKVLEFFRAIFDLWLVGKGAAFVTTLLKAAAAMKTLIGGGGVPTTPVTPTGTPTPTPITTPVAPAAAGKSVTTAIMNSSFLAGLGDAIFSPVGLTAIGAMELYPIFHREMEAQDRRNYAKEVYGKEYTELSSGAKEYVELGFDPTVAESLDRDRKNIERTNIFGNIAVEIEEFVDQVQDYNAIMNEELRRLEEEENELWMNNDLPVNEASNWMNNVRGWLPASWWSQGSDETKNLPGQMSDAVVRGMTNVRVVMDGETVGNLVAPYVSQRIARDSA